MNAPNGYLSPAVAGSGSIAAGLAACASLLGEVRLLARSDASAGGAEEQVAKICSKLKGADHSNVRISTDPATLATCDLVIEAIAEDAGAKVELHRALAAQCPEADLATTTSSLGVADLAEQIGVSGRFFGLHVFNPVHKMELIELCLPDGLAAEVAERARAFCSGLAKTAVEVPDQPGFVVNRLLFPYLFDAVRFMQDSGMTAADVDSCMSLGAGHPMGPLRLLDLVGLDVAIAIGSSLELGEGGPERGAPGLIRTMVAAGKLGRKSGEGFYSY